MLGKTDFLGGVLKYSMGKIFFNDPVLNETYGGRDLLKLGKTPQSVVTQVRNNDFHDLYIGDYFTTDINNRQIKWHIADFNYFLNTGDINFTKPHLVLINGESIDERYMNSERSTIGGYYNSAMRSVFFDTYLKLIKNTILGEYILTHREILTNSINRNVNSGGCPIWQGCTDNWRWYDSTIELLTEPQVYGSPSFGSSGHDIGIGHTQFAIFKLNKQFISLNRMWWLRTIADQASFCSVRSDSIAYTNLASDIGAVRIYFCFG